MVLILTWEQTDLKGQDPAMSQFYANALYLNPGMAGAEGPMKVYLGYRNLWPGSGSQYTVYHASYEQYVEQVNGGLALHVMNDRQGGGVINTTSLDAIYAYHLKVNPWTTITGGFQASVGQRNLRAEDLLLPSDLLNETAGSLAGYSKFYPDFSVGFGVFHKRLYGGLAVHHLHQPYVTQEKMDEARLSRRYSLHMGALIPIYEKRLGREVLQLSPNLVFLQQNIYQQLNYGLEILYKGLLLGLWGRQDLKFSYGTLIFSVGYAREQFRFRYSYDARLHAPDLQLPGMGAHEISMAYVFENLNRTPKRRAIKSPKI